MAAAGEPELVVHYEIWGGFVHPK
ncbi:hypothetical protein J1605_000470 [Eschrichtius robustus]|uniref:Uncharacterized protein n=1 Tax=Eschrichtius robustus TaxID=9764 RepID=A0AB34HA30_ESCRO|nr:hypothetical protein J1605_000470 [Eschrichtius robustus]